MPQMYAGLSSMNSHVGFLDLDANLYSESQLPQQMYSTGDVASAAWNTSFDDKVTGMKFAANTAMEAIPHVASNVAHGDFSSDHAKAEFTKAAAHNVDMSTAKTGAKFAVNNPGLAADMAATAIGLKNLNKMKKDK